jgi:hypothetical protein
VNLGVYEGVEYFPEVVRPMEEKLEKIFAQEIEDQF